MNCTLIINKASVKKRQAAMDKAQSYIDSESLRLMTPYVPVGLPRFRNSGKLRDSGKVDSPGVIVYTAPKARSDYYNDKVDHAHGGNPHAQRLWFEVMKAKHCKELLRGACKITGGKGT